MPAQLVPMTNLRASPHNPRRATDPEYIQELSRSMAENGQWDPVLLRPLPDGILEIVAGHCRVEAARSLGWTTINAEIRDLTDEEADFLALDTNLKRRNLSEIEEAEAIRLMVQHHGWTQERVAQRFGKTKMWVSYRLSLLTLHPQVREQVNASLLTATHGREIAQAPAHLQPSIARKVQEAELNTRETEALVKVAMDPAIPQDVKRALLESERVTPEHAAAIAKLPTAIEREGFIRAVENGRLTVEETTKEVEAALKPQTISGERARRHLEVGKTLLRAREALDEIGSDDIAGLDGQALTTTEAALRNMGTRLQELLRWVTVAQTQHQARPREGKVVGFRPSHGRGGCP